MTRVYTRDLNELVAEQLLSKKWLTVNDIQQRLGGGSMQGIHHVLAKLEKQGKVVRASTKAEFGRHQFRLAEKVKDVQVRVARKAKKVVMPQVGKQPVQMDLQGMEKPKDLDAVFRLVDEDFIQLGRLIQTMRYHFALLEERMENQPAGKLEEARTLLAQASQVLNG